MKVIRLRLRKQVIPHLLALVLLLASFLPAALAEAAAHPSVGWKAIAVGTDHNLGIKADGTVWAWGGGNRFGRFGNGEGGDDAPNTMAPVQVSVIQHAAAVAAGMFHSLALTEDGRVWAWGANDDGQIGDGKQSGRNPKNGTSLGDEDRYTPVELEGLTDVVAIAADYNRSFALRKDGTVWAWGGVYYRDANGQLHNVRTPTQLKQFSDIVGISLGYGSTWMLKKDGTVWTNVNGRAVSVPGVQDMIQIASGGAYTYGLRKDHTVWYWGSSGVGKVNGTDVNDSSGAQQMQGIDHVVSIQATGMGPLLLKEDGTVWASGDNVGGQLGIGTYEDSDVPVQVHKLTRVKTIAASGIGFRSMAIRADGTLWSWGNGYVGDGTEWWRTEPVWVRSQPTEAEPQENPVFVDLDGQTLAFEQPAIISGGRAMVPLRGIFEAMGAEVTWDAQTSTVTARKGTTEIRLTIGQGQASRNGEAVQLDAPAIVQNGATLVPIRFIGESFGAGVEWDAAIRTVRISMSH